MKAACLVAASLIGGSIALTVPAAAQTTVPVGTVWVESTVESTLRHDPALRALELAGDPGRPFVVVAGTARARLGLGEGVELLVAPEVVLAIGRLDLFGRAFVPISIHGAGQAGDTVYTQALLWPRAPRPSILPDRATAVAEVVLEAAQTGPAVPPFEPGERLRIVEDSGYGHPTATLVIADGVPPQHLVQLDVEAPTTGHVLRVDSVRHRGSLSRIHATLERPHPSELVAEILTPLRATVGLGAWSGEVEIVLEVTVRAATSAEDAARAAR